MYYGILVFFFLLTTTDSRKNEIFLSDISRSLFCLVISPPKTFVSHLSLSIFVIIQTNLDTKLKTFCLNFSARVCNTNIFLSTCQMFWRTLRSLEHGAKDEIIVDDQLLVLKGRLRCLHVCIL